MSEGLSPRDLPRDTVQGQGQGIKEDLLHVAF